MTAYSESYHALDFVVAPLRKLLQSQDRPLEGKLLQLAVLAVRYQLFYVDDIDTASVGIFSTDTRSFESLAERPPWELAESITISDLTNFRHLSLQIIMDNDDEYRYIGRGWNEWSLAVQEGALVGQNFAKKALEVAKAG